LGNVGIGTSAPDQLLTLSAAFSSSPTGSIRLIKTGTHNIGGGGYIQFDTSVSATARGDYNARIEGIRAALDNGSSELIFFTTNTVATPNSVERMRITSAGNVGIGTTTPDANLTVNGAASFAAGTALLPSIARSSDLNTGFWFPAADTIAASTAGSERLRITSTGNVGIGTSSPAAKLSVDGSAIFNESGADVDFRVEGDTDANLLFVDASTDRIGVGTGTPGFKLEVNGSFAATTKSFIINHPTKPGKKLRYGSLEGPENGVYIRGRLRNNDTIILPEYWTKLVDHDSITVNLTPIGSCQKLFVESVAIDKVTIKNENMFSKTIDCYYTIFAERNDVDKLEVEI
jgi:hypothetical protein